MNIKFVAISVFAVVCVFASDISIAKSNSLSDDQVSQRIIDDSVASYPGTCACPFNTARYKKEVTKEMVKAWRQENQ
ncbi:hypothetical protein DD584_22275 [Klebsiella pneumoniae]|nr:hypothetical protein DD584_22275 [Klebsiella pneumoniae]